MTQIWVVPRTRVEFNEIVKNNFFQACLCHLKDVILSFKKTSCLLQISVLNSSFAEILFLRFSRYYQNKKEIVLQKMCFEISLLLIRLIF